jgi:hypothetical protein
MTPLRAALLFGLLAPLGGGCGEGGDLGAPDNSPKCPKTSPSAGERCSSGIETICFYGTGDQMRGYLCAGTEGDAASFRWTTTVK